MGCRSRIATRRNLARRYGVEGAARICRSLSILATLFLGLAVVFWAPAAKADCPHNNNDAHQHCVGGTPSTSGGVFEFVGFTTIETRDQFFYLGGGHRAVRECLLLATSRHPTARNRSLLWPQERTFQGPRWTSAFDPGCVKTISWRPRRNIESRIWPQPQ